MCFRNGFGSSSEVLRLLAPPLEYPTDNSSNPPWNSVRVWRNPTPKPFAEGMRVPFC